MNQQEFENLWLDILAKVYFDKKSKDLTEAQKRDLNRKTISEEEGNRISEKIRAGLFFKDKEKPISGKSLSNFHDRFRLGEKNTASSKLQLKTQTLLSAYLGDFPNNTYRGTWISYQFPTAKEHLLHLSNEGNKESYVATRTVWLLIPETTDVCRAIGYRTKNKEFRTEARASKQQLYISSTDVGTTQETEVNFALISRTAERLEGYQTLFEFKDNEMYPQSRRSIWIKVSEQFERNCCEPLIFKTKEALINDAFSQKLGIIEFLNTDSDKNIPPQYDTQKDELVNQIDVLKQQLEIVNSSKMASDKELLVIRENLEKTTTAKNSLEQEKNNVLAAKADIDTDLAKEKNIKTKIKWAMFVCALLFGLLYVQKYREVEVPVFQCLFITQQDKHKSLDNFVGLWQGYVASTMARETKPDLRNYVVSTIIEFTNSGKGYLSVRRWSSNLYFEGIAWITPDGTFSVYVREISNEMPTSRSRFTVFDIDYGATGSKDSLYGISASWPFGGKGSGDDLIGIREFMKKSKYFNLTVKSHKENDVPIPIGVEKCKYNDVILTNDTVLKPYYVHHDSIEKGLQPYLDANSFISRTKLKNK